MNNASNNILKNLLSYQIPHPDNIMKIIKNKNICLDGSDTGTGKTYVAMAVIKYLNAKSFIICPKTIMSTWKKVAEIFGVDLLGIVNYETITRGKYYSKDGSRIKCPYVVKDNKQLYHYKWNLPDNSIIIFDEAHHCCNENTLNAQLLMSLLHIYNEKIRILILSATIADNATKFKIFGYLFKWYRSIQWAPEWLRNKKYNPVRANLLINQLLYPEFGSRMRINDIGEMFKINKIRGEFYDIDNSAEIENAYNDLAEAFKNIKNKKINDLNNPMTIILRARQKIELCKISLFIDLTNEYLENGFSVVIFVNFTDTLKILSNRLNTNSMICGGQNIKTRQKNIDDFMINKNKIIICNIHSGSESISLDDLYGNHPRVSLISPTWSSTKLVQAFGRTQRANTKSVALNKIIYCAKTIEEKMCNKINEKLRNLSSINDYDLKPDDDDE